MHKKLVFILGVIFFGLAISGFQCSSTEITSAKLYIQQKNYDKALDVLKKEVEKNPQSDEGFYLLGVVSAEKEQFEPMIDAWSKSLSISEKFKKDIENQKKYWWAQLFNKGVSMYQRGIKASEDSNKVFYDKSIDCFNYAVKLEPDSADTYKNLAFVYLSAQRLDEAIEPLQKIIDLNKEIDGYRFLGEIYYNKGQVENDQFKTTKEKADSVKAMEWFSKAIVVLEAGRKEYQNDSDILLTLSNSYIAANKVEVALDAFKTGVANEPDNKYYRYNYGVLLLGKAEYEAAEKQFLKAVELDPDYQNANYNLAVTYVRWGTAINKAAEDSGEMNNSEYKGKYQQALPYLEKVTKNEQGDNSSTWELIGKVYTVLGMQDKATEAFNNADNLRK
ncbi:MAG: tetratricopeptide repeat protein [Ignavibacteriaceae bacterium]|nr:tetratricopeptide repeat protein [Ignavibacteriaceae bacterium]